MKNLLLAVAFLVMSQTIFGQNPLAQRLHDSYELYKEKSLTIRRFKQKDLLPLVDKLKINAQFQVSEAGKSFEGRPIPLVRYGKGAPPVLLWSQMHGDEATATLALLDIFNFLSATGDGFDDFRKKLYENSSLYFVPMLNPDGAELWQRRTAQGIDMNRDALRLQTPESVILKGLQQSLKPSFGFNLHDQSPRYSAGNTPNVAVVSFLATAYDQARSMNTVRLRSMQLIAGMNRELQKFIPNQVARYSDEHEPRAFGDNIQKWGTSLVLIESGGYKNDPEKQYIRKLNFIAILVGLEAIANGTYTREVRADYDKLPQNEKYHFDLLIRNARVNQNGRITTADVGINRNEINNADATAFTYKSSIEDFGDLSVFYGIEEINVQGALITDENGQTFTPQLNGTATFQLQLNKKSVYSVVNGFAEKK